MGLQPIDVRTLEDKTANIYEAIIVAGKKARMINDEQKLEFNLLLGTLPPVTNEDDGEDFDNPAQRKISLQFELRPKPHLRSLDSLVKGELKFEYFEKAK